MSGKGNRRGLATSVFALIVTLAAVGYGSRVDPPATASELEAVSSTPSRASAGVTDESEPTAEAPSPDPVSEATPPPENEEEFGPGVAPTQAPPAPAPDGAREPTVLRLVYFVEADQEYDPAAVAAIERQAVALQQYWYDQFGGTFRLSSAGVETVYGVNPARWYDTTVIGDDERWYRLMNIREEVNAALDLPAGTDEVRTLTFPAARIDGRVGANRYEGAWMDGDDISCIDDIVETTPYTPDFPASCLGTLAHELGHVYGLGHEGWDEDCMQYGFYQYVSGSALCDFSPENRRIVTTDPRNARWLDARPGARS